MKKFRLEKRVILKSSREFNEVFNEGQRFSSPNLLLFYKDSADFKIGFAVSKKIGGAVRRNRARRRLRELFRLNPEHRPARGKLIVMAKAGVEKVKFAMLKQEFVLLLQKAKTQQK